MTVARPAHVRNNFLYSDVWSRMHRQNRNFMAVICGQTGSGKSWAGLRLAWDLDRDKHGKPRFNIDRVVFTAEDFLALVRKKMPAGSFVIWDEAGVGLNARQWYSLKNQLISYVTQTFRFQNRGVIYTVPSFNYVDKQVRQLFHVYIRMYRPYHELGLSSGAFMWMDYNPTQGTIYYKLPRYYQKGEKKIAQSVRFPKPPKELVEAYEEKKKEIAEQWYDLYHKQMDVMKSIVGVGSGMPKSDVQELLLTANEIRHELIDSKGKYSSTKILLHPKFKGISVRKAEQLARMLRESGSA